MESIVLFGNKEIFAIQIEVGPKLNKSKLCYWVSNCKVGNFSKADELKDTKKSFLRFEEHNDRFYLPELEPFNSGKLREFFFEDLFKLLKSGSKKSLEEVKHRQSFCLNWGIQVDGYNVIILYKPGFVLFFYTPPKKEPILEVIPFDLFQSVFTEFLSFCDENNLV
jgi:hypothetical protein